MKKRKKLLVLSPLFGVNAPQPTRFREFVSHWSGYFDITVLAFRVGETRFLTQFQEILALMEMGRAGKLLIGSRLKNRDARENIETGHIRQNRRLKHLLKKIRINRFFFPDIFIVEYFRIKKQLYKQVIDINPDVVIISTSPFTLMLLAGPLKKRFPCLKIIIDTGDPFYGDGSSYSKRLFNRLFAKPLEKKCLKEADLLVVPSMNLKRHYLSTFMDVINKEKVKVIEDGIRELFIRISEGRRVRKAHFRMVYAGRFYELLRDPSELYAAVTLFSENEIQLRIFGNNQGRFVPPLHDKRFLLGGTISTEQLAIEYQEADMIVFIDNAYGVQVPGKAYEVLAINRPVLCIVKDEKSPSSELFKDQDGVVVVHNDRQEIVAGISKMMNTKPGQQFNREFHRYTFEVLAKRYYTLIEELTADNKAT